MEVYFKRTTIIEFRQAINESKSIFKAPSPSSPFSKSFLDFSEDTHKPLKSKFS